MALPKQRHTTHRRDRARRELALTPARTTSCPQCSAPVLPHKACPKCGTYKGRAVVTKGAPKLASETRATKNVAAKKIAKKAVKKTEKE